MSFQKSQGPLLLLSLCSILGLLHCQHKSSSFCFQKKVLTFLGPFLFGQLDFDHSHPSILTLAPRSPEGTLQVRPQSLFSQEIQSQVGVSLSSPG